MMKTGYGDNKPINRIGDMQPIEFKVLVKLDVVEDKSAGGIYLPESAVEREGHAAERGTIINMADNAFFDNEIFAEKPVVGNRVLFAKYSGMLVIEMEGRDKVKYRLMNDKDICAILN